MPPSPFLITCASGSVVEARATKSLRSFRFSYCSRSTARHAASNRLARCRTARRRAADRRGANFSSFSASSFRSRTCSRAASRCAAIFSRPRKVLPLAFAEALSIGTGDALIPTLSPDGLWILYAATPKPEGSSLSVRLMRVPLSGGVPQEIFKPGSYMAHDCGRLPGTLCVLAERTEREIVFRAFDPVQGKGRELTRIPVSPSDGYDLAVSPDGSRIAVTKNFDPTGRIRILSSTGEPERDVVVKGWGGFGTVNWQADGRGFFVSSLSPQGASLLHVSMNGRAQVLWEQKGSGKPYGVSSPNGHYLAFQGSTADSNVWLIENF